MLIHKGNHHNNNKKIKMSMYEDLVQKMIQMEQLLVTQLEKEGIDMTDGASPSAWSRPPRQIEQASFNELMKKYMKTSANFKSWRATLPEPTPRHQNTRQEHISRVWEMRHSGKLDEALEAVWTDTGEKVKFDENGEPIDEIQEPIDQDNNLSNIIRMSLGGSVEKNSLECVVQAFENCSVQGQDGVSRNQTGHKKNQSPSVQTFRPIRNPPSMFEDSEDDDY